jgi:TRAP-type C4-dicarboxylate transport system permease small subunit
LKLLKSFDRNFARGEAALAAFILLSMIGLASTQAVLANIGSVGAEWAHELLRDLSWIDDFLKKGTLWLAFLGASLATRDERHIAIDLLPRFSSRRFKLVTQGLASMVGAVVSFFLARAFWAQVLLMAQEDRGITIETDEGTRHLCDATAAALAQAHLDAPTIFCGARSVLGAIGVPVATPSAAFQLVVPVMFVIIAIRFLANGIGAWIQIGKPAADESAKG